MYIPGMVIGNYKPIKSESQIPIAETPNRQKQPWNLQTSVSKSQTIWREFSYLFMFYTTLLTIDISQRNICSEFARKRQGR